MIIQGRHKYVAALYDEDELYDLEADPWEMTNLSKAGTHRDLVVELRARLVQHVQAHERGFAARLLAVSLQQR
jgi:arylsulfatase A-like enzyme